MKKQKLDPEQVRVTFATVNNKTCDFSLAEIYTIQSAAKSILKEAVAGELKESLVGICYNIYAKTKLAKSTDIIRLVGHIATRWPHNAFPGVYSVYPVPRPEGYESWWEGESLKYRINLLRYIIKRLKDTIRRAEKNGKATIC